MSDVQSAISSAISQANSKAAEKSEGDFNEQVARDRVSIAQNRISTAESKVNRHQSEMSNIEQQLNPPPTKEVEEGGKNGGTKTVVDNEEVRRLNSKKTAIQQQITQAQSEVSNAQEAAQNAANDAITQSGINSETQNEIDTLMSKANNIKSTLSEGGKVEDDQIKDLTGRFDSIAGGLTAEDNKAGILSEAFYEPFADVMKEIGELLKNPVSDAEAAENAGDEVIADDVTVVASKDTEGNEEDSSTPDASIAAVQEPATSA